MRIIPSLLPVRISIVVLVMLFWLFTFKTINAQTHQEVITDVGSGSFIVPVGVVSVTVEVWGGGGGGGSSVVNDTGGGGGGGAYSQSSFLGLSGGQSFSYFVGEGGTQGQPGQNTWFNTTEVLLARGGSAGLTPGIGSGGLAAEGFGEIRFSGGSGGTGQTSGGPSSRRGGGGGGSATALANGANGAHGDNGGTGGTGEASGGTGGQGSTNGGQGGLPGGGGGGAGVSSTAGTGGNGRIIITYNIPQPSPETSTITAANDTIIADGTSNTTITLQLKYPNGDNVTSGGHNVVLSTTAGVISNLTDHNNGTYTAILTSSTLAQTAIVSGTINDEEISDSATVEFVGGHPTKLVFHVHPTNALMDQTIDPAMVVHLLDAHDNLSINANNTITLEIANDASAAGDAEPDGTLIVAASEGVASFDDISINKPGEGYTLRVTAAGITQATSNPFNINTPALRLQYLNSNTNPTSQTLYPVLQVYNDDDATLALSDITVRYYFTSEPPGDDLHFVDYAVVGSGNVTGIFVDELGLRYLEVGFTPGATIPAWEGGNGVPNEFPPAVSTGEIQNRIRDSAWGFYDQTDDYSWDPTFTSYADHDKITVYYKGELAWGTSPGPISGGVQLRFSQQPTITPAGEIITPPVTIRIEDAEGNLVTDAEDPVIISLVNNPADAAFFGTHTADAVNGIATFNDLAFSKPGTGFVLQANSPGMLPDNSDAFTVTEAVTANLRLHYRNVSPTPISDVITPFLILYNDGFADIALADVTIRYWFTSEPPGDDVHVVDWAAVGTANVTGAFFGSGNQRFLEIGFTADANIPGGDGSNNLPYDSDTGEIRQRIHDSAWGDYDQSDDHSWDPAFTEFADHNNITVYYKGQRVWGVPSPLSVVYVNTSAAGANDGTSWTDAFTDLQSALDAAVSGQHIWVAAGTYYPTQEVGGTGYRYRSFQMRNDIEIYGGFAGNEDPLSFDLDDRDFEANTSILSGEISMQPTPVYHVFRHVNIGLNHTAVLDGFTITGGLANGSGDDDKGGGMLNMGTTAAGGSSPTIRNSTFINNTASHGGAIYNSRYSNPNISRSSFIQNTATLNGGAMYNTRNNPVITYCTFIENVSQGTGANAGGGAIYNNAQNTSEGPIISHSDFINNEADRNNARGGAIFNNMNPGTALVEHCVFDGNAAQYGGAIYNASGNDANRDASDIQIHNSTFRRQKAEYGGAVFSERHHTMFFTSVFQGNEASEHGGAFYGRFASSEIINSLITGNQSLSQGGALYYNNETPVLTNTTISGNFSDIRGGGISLVGASEATLQNSILWGNASAEGNQIRLNADCQVTFDHSLFAVGTNDVVIISGGTLTESNSSNADPLFVTHIQPTLGNTPNTLGNYMISGFSPAVDSGLTSHLPAGITMDIRGEDRIIDGNEDGSAVVDMGAYEFNPETDALAPYGIVLSGPGSITAGSTSPNITLTVVDINGSPAPVSQNTVFHLSSTTASTVSFVPASPISIPEGEYSVNFTYSNTKAGDQTITAQWVSGEALLSGTITNHIITVNAGPANRFAFAAAPNFVAQNSLADFILEIHDEYGNPTPDHGVYSNIVSVSGGAGTLIPSSVNLAAGATQAIFRWMHDITGEYTITADATGIAAANHTIEVLEGADPLLFSYYKIYQTDHTQVSGSSALTDFPVLFSSTHPDYRHVTQGGKITNYDGFDVLFTAADGETVLDHDLEHYDPVTGTIIAWVRFPSLSATANTTFYVYFGNTAIATDLSTPTTWDDDYRLVMHLNNTLDDASTYNNTATNSGTMALASGMIGGARSFTPPSFIQVDDDASLDITGDISMSLWINGNNLQTSPDLITKGDWTQSYTAYINFDRQPVLTINGVQYVDNNALDNGTWYYLAFTKGASGWAIYIDGVLTSSGSQSQTIDQLVEDLFISSAAFPFAGLMDEVRVSSAERSSDWIATKYNNQVDPESFLIRITPDADPDETTITAVPDEITADGESVSLITVQAKDADGSNITQGGASVSLNTTAGTLSAVADNGDGTYMAELTSSTNLETAIITGTINGEAIADDASVSFVPGVPAKLLFDQQPLDGFAGETLVPALRVMIVDANDNPVSDAINMVYMAIENNPAEASLGGTTPKAPEEGIAIFDDLSIDLPGIGFTLKAYAAGLSHDISDAFNIMVSSLADDVVLSGPNSVTAGMESDQFSLTVVDEHGDPATVAMGTVFELASSEDATAGFIPASTVTIPAGQSNVTFTYSNTLVGTHTITATWISGDPNLEGVSVSRQIIVNAAPPSQYVFIGAPGSITLFSEADFVLQVQDEFGNPSGNHSGFNDVVSVSGNAGTLNPTQVDFLPGEAETAFTWAHSQTGLYTISASGSLTPANHDVEVLDAIDPNSFGYFKTFETDHTQVAGSAALTDFPVLFDYTHEHFRHTSSGGLVENSNGFDIIFTNADGSIVFDHDLEFFDDEEGRVIAWVRFPSLSATENTTFRVYYGNQYVDHDLSTPTTWNDEYRLVMHLNDDVEDASTYQNTSTDEGTTHAPAGKIAGGRSFATGQRIEVNHSDALNLTNHLTISLWVNASDFSNSPDLVTKGAWNRAYSTWVWSDGEIAGNTNTSILNSTGTISTDNWAYVVFTKGPSGRNIYINGAPSGSDTYTLAIESITANLFISTTAYPYNGLLDEIRISSIARSANWIATKYNNQDDPDNFIINATNYPPILADIEETTLEYIEGEGQVFITETMTVNDANDTHLTGASIAVVGNYVSGEDVLGFTNTSAISGSFNASEGVLTLSGAATVAAYQTALRNVTYENTSSNPDTEIRTVSFMVNDGEFDSNILTRDISITIVNTPPVLANIETVPLAYQAGDGAVLITQSITASDPDNPELVSAVVEISNNYISGEDVLGFPGHAGITGSWNAVSGRLTLTGNASVFEYQQALRMVTYENTSGTPTYVTRTVSFMVNDGEDDSNIESRDISITVEGAFAGLLLWLNGEEGTFQDLGGTVPATLNGQPVREWHDQSGNERIFSTPGTPPTLATNVPELNGRSAIRFAGTGDELADLGGGSYINGLTEFTIFIVIKSDRTDTDRGFWHTKDPDGQDDIFTIRYDEEGFYADPLPVNNIKLGILTDSPPNQIESYSDVQTTDGQIVMVQWKSGDTYDLFVDGIINNPALLFDPPEGSLFGATKALIGKGSKDGNTMSWDGLIGEVILYNRLLETTERLETEDYLSEKYGISIRALTPATGGEAISADDVGGDFTTLTGPIIKEGFRGQLAAGRTLVFKVPDGFEWDTSGSNPAVAVSPVYGGITDLQVNFTSRTNEEITFTVTQASSASPSSRIGQLDFSNLRVRPVTGQLPNEGIIINVGTTGFAGQTNYGNLGMVAGAPNRLYYSRQPGNVTINLPITPAVRVQVQDQFGNNVQQEGIPIDITLSEGSGTLSGTIPGLTDTTGEATFNDLSIDDTGIKQLAASAAGIVPEESNLFKVRLDGEFTTFLIEEVPSGDIGDKIAGEEFDITISAVDGNGIVDTDFTGKVIITSNGVFGTGVGTTASFVNGVLASHTVSIISTGIIELTATNSEGTETGISNPFEISPGPPSLTESTITAVPAVILNNGTSTSLITVQLKDDWENPLTTGGHSVTLFTTAGSLSAVTDHGNGSYTAILTSSTTPVTAVIGGTLNGQPLANTVQVIFASFDYIWQGTLGDDPTADQWEYGPNWNTGTVPGPGSSVLIPSNPLVGNKFPVVSITNTVAGNVLIETGANLTIMGGVNFIVEDFMSGNGALINGSTQDSLTIGGTLDITSISLGTVVFNGAQDQTIVSPHVYTNMVIDNPGTVYANDNLIVDGLLSLEDGILRIPNNRVLIANNKAIGSGQLQFVRTISGPKGWRMLGSPVSSTYGDLLDGTVTQGYPGSSMGMEYNGNLLQPNVFWYEESFPGTDNQRWRVPGSADDPLVGGRGLYVYFFGDVPEDPRYNQALPDTLIVTGQEFEGNGIEFDFNITYTAEADTGWNFVSNPFGASLNWDSPGWTKTNMDNTIYIWKPSANGNHGEFLTWNGSSGTLGNGLIRPFQGFWVKAQGPGAELRVQKAAKTVGGTFYQKDGSVIPDQDTKRPFYKSYPDMMADSYDATKPLIILKAKTGALEAHKTITFREGASKQKDTYDGYRLLPLNETFVALFSTLDDGSELVVNNLPDAFSNRMRIPIHVGGYIHEKLITGPYTISWPGVRNIPADWVLLLVDNETGERINLRQRDAVTFNLVDAKPDATYPGNNPGDDDYRLTNKNYDKARFTLVISNEEIEENIPWDVFLMQNFPNPVRESTTIRFGLAEDSNVRIKVYDILGNRVEVLVSDRLHAGFHEYYWTPASLRNGIYFVVLETDKETHTFKSTILR